MTEKKELILFPQGGYNEQPVYMPVEGSKCVAYEGSPLVAPTPHFRQMQHLLAVGLEPAPLETILRAQVEGKLDINYTYEGANVFLFGKEGVKVGLDKESQRRFWNLIQPEAEVNIHELRLPSGTLDSEFYKGRAILLPEGMYEEANAQLELKWGETGMHKWRSGKWSYDKIIPILEAEVPDTNLLQEYFKVSENHHRQSLRKEYPNLRSFSRNKYSMSLPTYWTSTRSHILDEQDPQFRRRMEPTYLGVLWQIADSAVFSAYDGLFKQKVHLVGMHKGK